MTLQAANLAINEGGVWHFIDYTHEAKLACEAIFPGIAIPRLPIRSVTVGTEGEGSYLELIDRADGQGLVFTPETGARIEALLRSK